MASKPAMPSRTVVTTVREIEQLFAKYGSENYLGEDVTQEQHAIQCAMQAEQEKESLPTVVGALLHDIGHLLSFDQDKEKMTGSQGQELGGCGHEYIGADWLEARGFSNDVTDLVKHHVSAKRYLVYTDRKYHDVLSEASKATLVLQGGPMSSKEAAEFRSLPTWSQIVKCRRWDDAAKDKSAKTPQLDGYLDLIRQYLDQQNLMRE